MSSNMMKFKINGVTLFFLGCAYVLLSRNSGVIMGVSNGILTSFERIMMCDFISLFMVLCYIIVFGLFIPAISFEIRVCLE
jgi:hypothetical protein